MTRATDPRPSRRSKATPGTLTDQVKDALMAYNAFVGLEHFLTPVHEDEEQASVPSSRAEMASMLHSFNLQMLHRLNALAETAAELEAAEELRRNTGSANDGSGPAN